MLACLQTPPLFGLGCCNLRAYRVGMCVDIMLVQTCHVEQCALSIMTVKHQAAHLCFIGSKLVAEKVCLSWCSCQFLC